MTETPVRYRTWLLSNTELITTDGVKFLISLGIKVRTRQDDYPVHTYAKSYYVYGRTRIEFETTCDKQESMLKLKYGKDLTLLLEEMVFPNSFHTCTLDSIKWP